MLTRRIIPCLDVRDGRVVKGKKFKDIIDVEDPEVLGEFYSREGADELVFYDITATHEARRISLEFIEKVATRINIPFCVGGGVADLEDFTQILRRGADKVSVNSAAAKNPRLITEASLKFGAQCVVLSMDVKQTGPGSWRVMIGGGRIDTGLDALEWAKEGVRLGAGELVINSIDADGMKAGYDIDLLREITRRVGVPVIASGGAGKVWDFAEAVRKADVDGVLAASVFHYKELSIRQVKEYMKSKGIEVRL